MTPPNNTNTPDVKTLEAKIAEQNNRFEAGLNALTKQLNDQLSGVNSVIAKLAGNSPNPANPQTSDPFYVPPENDETWYENFRAAPTKVLSETIKPQMAEVERKVEQKLEQKFQNKSEEQKFDGMAYSKYPQLKDPNHPLRKATEQVLATSGKDFASRPSAIYDAARIAYADLVQQGEILPEKFKEEAMRLLSINDGLMFPFKSGTDKPKDDLTPSQAHFANRLGISQEKYKERLKKLGSRNPND